MPYEMEGPTFAFCGTFSGQGDSAYKWVRKFEHEMSEYKMDGRIPPDKFMKSIDLLLTGEAGEWSECHPKAIRLLKDPTPTPQTVADFKALLYERFPFKALELASVSIDTELQELKQRAEESLAAYYKRTIGIMQRMRVSDRSTVLESTPLSPLKAIMLDKVFRSFVEGIKDVRVRREASRGMTTSDRSLKMIYQATEEARRNNVQLQKQYEKKLRKYELKFLRDFALKNLPKQKIDVMFTSFHVDKIRSFQRLNPS